MLRGTKAGAATLSIVAALFLLGSGACRADERGWACWRQAALRYNVPMDLLYSIARVESHNEKNPIHWNNDGSYDMGLMQINSSWLPTLKRYGITRQTLLDQPCTNLNVGAWILANDIHRYGMNWRGVGSYNANSPVLQARYARSVADELRRVARLGYSESP